MLVWKRLWSPQLVEKRWRFGDDKTKHSIESDMRLVHFDKDFCVFSYSLREMRQYGKSSSVRARVSVRVSLFFCCASCLIQTRGYSTRTESESNTLRLLVHALRCAQAHTITHTYNGTRIFHHFAVPSQRQNLIRVYAYICIIRSFYVCVCGSPDSLLCSYNFQMHFTRFGDGISPSMWKGKLSPSCWIFPFPRNTSRRLLKHRCVRYVSSWRESLVYVLFVPLE